jgi:molybdopterin converting factor small subunit
VGLKYPVAVCSSTMRVRVVSFGSLRAKFAGASDVWELETDARVATLLARVREAGLVDQTALDCAAIAVNHEYVSVDAVLHDGDEVAILPPVSGGLTGRVELVRAPIDVAMIQAEIKAGGDGAVCVFDGIVRDNTRGRATLHLDYEAYEEMALKQMQALRDEAIAKFGVREVAADGG